MNVALVKPLISGTKAEIEQLTNLTQTNKIADENRFTILACIEAVESDMKRFRKLVKGE